MKLVSSEREKREESFVLRWKWAWISAGLILVLVAGLYLFFSVPRPAQEVYVFSFEDSLERVYGEIGSDYELENFFNIEILASIEEDIRESKWVFEPNVYDDPLFWEELTEEEIGFLETEIKKEMKS